MLLIYKLPINEIWKNFLILSSLQILSNCLPLHTELSQMNISTCSFFLEQKWCLDSLILQHPGGELVTEVFYCW